MDSLSFYDTDYEKVLAYCQELDFKPYYTEIKWRCLNTPQNWYYFFHSFQEGSKRKKFVYDNAKHFRLRSFMDAVAFLMIAKVGADELLAVNTVKKKLLAMTLKDRTQAVEILQKSLEYAKKPLKIGEMK